MPAPFYTDDEVAVFAARLAPYRPADDDEVVAHVTSPTDSFARTEFSLHWMGHGFALSGRGYEHNHRGQNYHANLRDHLERSIDDGKRVRIIRSGAALEQDPYACLRGTDHDPRPFPRTCDTLGRLHMCACGRLWELRESVGFVVWAPADLAHPVDPGRPRCGHCGAHVFRRGDGYTVGGDMPCTSAGGEHAPAPLRWSVTEATL